MNDIKIDKDYRYVFNESENIWELYLNNKPHPAMPEKIFKFFACNIRNIAAFHEGYFWLAEPVSFNDPFDCNLNLLEYEDETISNLPFDIPRNNIKNIGISCFSTINDDPLIWAHYTDNYYGYAVKYGKITCKVNPEEYIEMDFSPVIYTNNFKIFKNTIPVAQAYVLSTKSKRWAYEKEWRIIKTISDEDRELYYDRNIVEEVYVGHKIPDNDSAAYGILTRIVEEKYPNAKMYVVYPSRHELKLDFEKIYPENE